MNVFPHDCHFGSQTEPTIRNGELCEDGYPKSPFGTNGRFRINELTRLVPVPVRSVLWNDGVGWLFYLN